MKGVAQHWLDMAYLVLVRINCEGKPATNWTFARKAYEIFPEVQAQPYKLVLLDRALRKLVDARPDVKRIGEGKYVAKQFEKSIEMRMK